MVMRAVEQHKECCAKKWSNTNALSALSSRAAAPRQRARLRRMTVARAPARVSGQECARQRAVVRRRGETQSALCAARARVFGRISRAPRLYECDDSGRRRLRVDICARACSARTSSFSAAATSLFQQPKSGLPLVSPSTWRSFSGQLKAQPPGTHPALLRHAICRGWSGRARP